MDLSDFREEYVKAGLEREHMADDPFTQFQEWFDQALKAKLAEPNAMVLSTVGREGQPTSRTVLAKQVDERGFVFYTNFGSTKARQIEQNPRVSLLFPWIVLERQVIVTGIAERVSMAEALRYFASRPFGSRLGAWVSPQSQVISKRALLEKKLDEMKRKFSGGEVPLPDFWGGYRVVPQAVEFWQGRASRLHDRFLYTRREEGWTLERLAP